jgi:uncharacterized repeat protein (TIGR01451 family)
MGGNPYRLQREWSNAITGCAMSYTTSSPFIAQPTLTFSTNIVQSTIEGNPGNPVTYNLTVTNPSNAEPAMGVVITTTLRPGLSRTGGSPLTFNVGDIGVHDTKNYTINLSPNTELQDGTVLNVSSSVGYKDSLGNVRPASLDSDSVTVANAQPALVLPADQSQDYHDALSFGISATDANASDTLYFSASGLPAGLTITDNGDRTATISGVPQAAAGNYLVTFSVEDHHHASAVTGTLTIHVLHEETTLVYTGTTVIANGFNATLSALLREDGVVPIAGRSVTLTLGAQSCPAVTDAAGNASCTILVASALGSVPITATFAGDAFYLPSGDSATAIVFQFLARGSFVLGNLTAAAATPTTSVNWWGSEWYLTNSLSGGVAPTSFKGFAATLTPGPPAAPACGGSWTTSGGNSAPPATSASIPEYMGVLVATGVGKNGSTIAGNIASIVVVQTDPGYSSSPGHPGRGTIVGTYC